MSTYVTNAIPFVNGDPHLGHALEFVQADVLARHRRLRGVPTRALSGTDDHAGKNRTAADAAGVPVAEFVSAHAAAFRELAGPLQLGYDDFLQTSSDPRHRPAVARLWLACLEAGDLYERAYEGRYCEGCEAFVDDDDLVDGRCPEHGTEPAIVAERNWFFRLSRYRDALADAIGSGRLEIRPATRRNEVLALLRDGLRDFSVSRPATRAGGWGLPVPGDPEQTIYVWFDALANYVSALGFGTDDPAYRRWWVESAERAHVVGKGVLRFHAVYWPAILLSAGQPLPTRVLVHDYLTVAGKKIGKSLGNGVAPAALVERHGADALRWWLLRSVPPVGDADFTEDALRARGDELADGLGNLVARVVALAARRPAPVPLPVAGAEASAALLATAAALPAVVDAAVDAFDLRAGADAVAALVAATNRYVSAREPWVDARRAADGDAAAGARLDETLSAALHVAGTLAHELQPFLPAGAARISAALADRDPAAARRLFPKAA